MFEVKREKVKIGKYDISYEGIASSYFVKPQNFFGEVVRVVLYNLQGKVSSV
ncbi:hypothetical protein [Bacillus cereus group sp. BfR-BA-01430]|uniref:hypothetical protein n=1 Tax=Bacillus cereus group sp. BfR-BA-01430 TaxID=2920346 RepID=UPI001F56E805|nr:hypothetical protein [Bacillus cereus group sp. BfR-BA-01430]